MKTAKEQTKKQSINLNKLKIRIAKGVAYTALVVAASYGIRQALQKIEPNAQMVITVILVLSLVFIISLKEEE